MLRMIYTSLLVLAFVGCGGSSSVKSQNETEITTGVVYDDLIVNLNYNTKDFNSSTNENGEFNYHEGKVDFYLGSVKIGSISSMPTDKKVFLTDILGLQRGDYKNSKLIKLARVLQSLDTTPSNDSKIVLDKTQVSDIFKTNQTLDNINIESLGISIVTSSQAKQAVKQTYINQNITPLPNNAPTANAGDDINTTENINITLDANKSSDSDGEIVKYEWYENDTLLHVGITYTTNSLSVGTHTITLRVTDDEEAEGSDEISITIKAKEVEPEPIPTPIQSTPIIAPTIDTTKPTATITPTNGSTNVAIDSNITITFNEEMNASTLNSTNITLKQGGASVAYAKTQSGNTLTLNPTNDFTHSTDYNLTIKDVTDKAGNKINPTTVNFTTIPVPSKLLKTGQATCYKGNTSTEIPCTSQTADKNATGQDGFYKKGVTRSYTRDNTKNIVKDNITGLEWQDEEYTAQEAAAYSNDTENGKALHWANAKTYCANLPLDGGGWRLPSIDELETIVDYGKRKGTPTGSKGAINPVFQNVGQSGYSGYWSSTTRLDDTSDAWRVYFGYGHDNWFDKGLTNYVRCAR